MDACSPGACIFLSLSALESQTMQIASSADRNLLFGILAWQSGVISETHLLEAMKRWTFEKHRSLSELLIELRALTPQQVQLLDPMVEAQIQLYEGKPSSALESMNSQPRIAKTLVRHIADQDLLASINRCASRHESDTLAKSTVEAEAEIQRYTGLRYIPQQLHAQGGLGAVYKATDSELNREVALKEIRPEFAGHAESRARFVLEAEVTGGLEHPGIVPVYGLGHHEDGRPFYAMRFIRGRSLKEAIDQFHQTTVTSPPALRGPLGGALEESASGGTESAKPKLSVANTTNGKHAAGATGPDFSGLEFRKLLGRFIDVCQAVGYAHSRGVLHRDIKPGNIMLGKYGETLVVDWGLAKVQGRTESATVPGEMTLQPSSGSGVAPTIAGQAMGTPAYMPPEQAAGRLDQLGPASDVYSLGATLYHLLTGQTPFQSSDVNLLLNEVQNGTFAAPRSIQPAVPESLQAVCLKAMSLRPADRYESPQDLAEEIERFLADEAVNAIREPLSIRARRWVRKHQVFATSTAAAIIVGMITLSVMIIVVTDKNRDLGAAKFAAETNARSAETQRDRAEQNEEAARAQSQLALSTLTAVIQDVQGGLRDLPGSGEIRRRLLTTSLDKLASVSVAWIDAAALDRSTWLALCEMGDVILLFGVDEEATPGSPSSTQNTKDSAVELAETFFLRALAISEKLAADTPDKSSAKHDMSISHSNLGRVYLEMGRTEEALSHFEKSAEICRTLSVANPDDTFWQLSHSIACGQIGDVLLNHGRTAEAIGHFETSEEVFRAMVSADPRNELKLRYLSTALERLGMCFEERQQTERAHDKYSEMLSIKNQISNMNPSDFPARRELAMAYDHVGDTLKVLGHAEDSVSMFDAALRIRGALADADKRDTQKQRDLAISYQKLGDIFLALGRMDDATEAFERGLSITRELATADPKNTQAQRALSASHSQLGEVNMIRQQPEKALSHFQSALKIRREIADADRTHKGKQRELSTTIERIGMCCETLGRVDEALKSFSEMRELKSWISSLEPLNVVSLEENRIAHRHLSDLLLRLGRIEEASRELGEGIDISRRLISAAPGDVKWQRDLLVWQERLGDVQVMLGQLEEARSLFEECVRAAQAKFDNDPGDAEEQHDLMILRSKLGDLYMTLERHDDALVQFECALSIGKEIAEANSGDSGKRRDLSIAYERLGHVLARLRRTDEALARFQDRLSIAVSLAADPLDAQSQRDLCVAHYNIAQIHLVHDEFSLAETSYVNAIAVLRSLSENGFGSEETKEEVSRLESELGRISVTKAALSSWDTVLATPVAELAQLLDTRGTECARRKRFAEAEQAARKLLEVPNVSNEHIYNAACIFCMCAASIQSDDGKVLVSAEATQRQALIAAGMAALRRSVANGWSDFAHIQEDPDLEVLHDLPEFRALIPPEALLKTAPDR